MLVANSILPSKTIEYGQNCTVIVKINKNLIKLAYFKVKTL